MCFSKPNKFHEARIANNSCLGLVCHGPNDTRERRGRLQLLLLGKNLYSLVIGWLILALPLWQCLRMKFCDGIELFNSCKIFFLLCILADG